MLVDDEALARQRLRHLLDDIAPELSTEIVAEAVDGIDALEQLDTAAVDIALLDIRMPRMDGIELARHLARLPAPPAVIFVTAYDQYAVKAFELNAIDYLLKPVRAERLLAALRKAKPLPLPVNAMQALDQLAPGGRRHLRCAERGRLLLVPVADVLYFKAELKYVTARTAEREYLLEESLAHLEQEFAARLVRIHRNCLVARDAVTGCAREQAHDSTSPDPNPGDKLVQPELSDPHWALLLKGVPERLPVSRRQWPQVKAELKI